jgi:hypothetical protein
MLSFTSKSWALVVGVVALSASKSNPESRDPPPVDVRPSVALLVTIDATDYLEKINDAACLRDCRIVRDALADSTLAIVRGTYPFLNWDDRQNATDTVNVRLTSKGSQVPWIVLDLRVSPATVRPESTLVDFETFKAFHDRDDRDDWSVDSLRRQWAKRMRDMLRNENLVESVFGRIPINAPAKINGRRWYVNVPARKIRQVSYETPTFEIRTLYSHPVQGVDSVSIRLAPCNQTPDFQSYNCGISRIVFRSRAVATGASLDSVLQQASFANVARVNLVTFKADTARGGLGGATW